MGLERLTERVWLYPHEGERDRPTLGYVQGDRWSLAVDAGHSAAHVEEFYDALRRAGLPLPRLTVLTHWHWDHAFGANAIHGLCVANARTNEHLKEARDWIARDGAEAFLAMDECIRREYADGQPVVVTLADVVFSGEMELDAGACPVRLLQVEAPHTDDSTLVFLPDEKVLFIGDAKSGVYPTWEKDPKLCRRLARTIEAIDAELCVGSHWDPMTKDGLLGELRSDGAPT